MTHIPYVEYMKEGVLKGVTASEAKVCEILMCTQG